MGAAKPRNAGRILYATDGSALSFRQLMDAFARRVGRRHPLHLPPWTKLFAKAIIGEVHMQQVALSMPAAEKPPFR